MNYKPPKTRIKIIKKVNGDTTYHPQYKMFFFSWEDMMGFPLYWVKDYDSLQSAQERIDKFLIAREKEYKQDVGGKIASVEYVKYP